MRTIRFTLLSIPLLFLCVSVMPGRAAAQTTFHAKWTECTLHFGPHGGFQSKQCHHYVMLRETRHPVSKTWREVERTPRLSIRVTWPVFYTAPVYALPGCPASIAQWAPYVLTASRATGVSVIAITGIIAIESGGNQYAYNPASGASGLGQFLPSTAAALGVSPFDPASAIMGIARYYRMAGASAYSGGGYGDSLIYARGCD